MAEQSNSTDDKLTIGRGPSYPFIDLERAIERIDQIAQKGAERSKMPPETFYKLWGYAPKSSGARQTMAALNYYGFVAYVGKGTDRRVTLSDLARRIVLDKRPSSDERRRAVAQAALEPAIFSELYEQYGPLLPDRTVMESWLTIDRGFNQQGAEAAVTNFVASIEYSGLDKPAGSPDEDNSQNRDGDGGHDGARVGDLIDWETNGVLGNAEPLKVRAVSADGAWVFVEGSVTGIPMDQTIVKERAEPQADRQPPTLPFDDGLVRKPSNLTPQLNHEALDVNFDMRSVVVSGRTTSPDELQQFIDDLLDLKPILQKRAARTAADQDSE